MPATYVAIVPYLMGMVYLPFKCLLTLKLTAGLEKERQLWSCFHLSFQDWLKS